LSPSSTCLAIRFGHFGLNCFDLGKMEAFYTKVFGFLVSDRGHVPNVDLSLVFMTLEPTDHHQFVLCSGRTEGVIRTDAFIGGGAGSAINQMSFQLKDLDELRRVRDRFAEFGITNGSPLNHGNAWAIYIRDIEGNPVELYVDTPWYTPQPFGEPLDLSFSDDQILQRTEAMCRSRPGFMAREEWQCDISARLAELRR
jgi:catechol 2,3-dioxygenase